MDLIVQLGSVNQLVKTADTYSSTYSQIAPLYSRGSSYGGNNLAQTGSDTTGRKNEGDGCSRRKIFFNHLNNIRCHSSVDDPGHISQDVEIRVCINKTCRKQGALQALDFFRSLSPPNATIETCGCLGKCGAGPNAILLPTELLVSHCNTGPHVARLLAIQCGASNPEINLQALELKNKGNAAFTSGDAAAAETLFSEGISLEPSGGIHNLYLNRSAARLALGNAPGALDDADQAILLKPGWSQAMLRKAEALSGADKYEAALEIYEKISQMDGEMRRSKQVQRRVKELHSKVASLTT